MQVGPVVSLCPSFNSYADRKHEDVAARVVEEFDSRGCSAAQRGGGGGISHDRVGDGDEGDFEFAFVTRDTDLSSPISADEIFHNGKIRPLYPVSVFNGDLLLGNVEFQSQNENGSGVLDSVPPKGPKVRRPLRKLFNEERETTMTTSSSSSSEADDLEGLRTGTYCTWRPKEATTVEEEGRSKSHNSKRWKFKYLLQKSRSYGNKDRFVFLTQSNGARKKERPKKIKETPAGDGNAKPEAPPYNRDGGPKQHRSYLPYEPDLVGFSGNVKGIEQKSAAI